MLKPKGINIHIFIVYPQFIMCNLNGPGATRVYYVDIYLFGHTTMAVNVILTFIFFLGPLLFNNFTCKTHNCYENCMIVA